MPQDIEVIKTLIIGLGTTGTKVCRSVAERVEWEYGGVHRAPWIRYLCLETDGNTARGPLPDEAFVHLQITPEEYAQVLTFAPAYDEFMDLRLWADEATLKKIPHGEVSSGAGNIRMVGRLALLFPRNFKAVRNLIHSNMRSLRLLDSAEARSCLGKLPDGSDPTITFRGASALRIFVTGSLCGGTCSGLTSDVGYLVGHIKQPEDKALAVLGLPRPDLADALEAHAERFKVNAFSALAELNHYCLPQIEKAPIKAGADVIATTGVSPYDVMYLAMPDAPGSDAEHRLTIAMADRIFLNSSVPSVDPFGRLADATIVDRNGHAHVFSTFGIRTIEFPRQRVIEGCTKKLLLNALRLWSKPDNRDPMKAAAQSAARSSGFTTQAMVAELKKTDKGQDVTRVLGDIVETISRAKSKSAVRDTLNYLRSVLGTGANIAIDGGLRPGQVRQWIQQRIEQVAKDRSQRMIELVSQVLLRRQGLQQAVLVLDAIAEELDKAESVAPAEVRAEMKETDDALDALRDARWWWRPDQRRFADGRARLIAAVRGEIEAALDMLTRDAIAAKGSTISKQDSLVTRCRQSMKPVRLRLDHLRQRITHMTVRLDAEVHSLAVQPPVLNGEAIFRKGQWEGTIGIWYQRELGRLQGEETRWEEAQARESDEIIALWTELPRYLRSGAEPDWLADDVDPDEKNLVPLDYWARLLDRARQPFNRLRERSVTDELMQLPHMTELINRACHQTREMVGVDDALATEGGRSPIPSRTVLLRHGSSTEVERIARAVLHDDLEVAASPDTSRLIFLRERYRFPLYGAPRIIGEAGSLAQASSGDFTSFHTRKDVFWTGLTRKEHEAQRTAEEVLVVAVLLGVAKLEHGRIAVQAHRTKPGDPDRVTLPFSVAHATRVLNPYRPGSLGTTALSPLLTQLTDQVKRRQESEDPEAFVRRLTRAFEEEGIGSQLPDWEQVAGDAVRRYCTRDDNLYTAYRMVFPPSEDRIARMRRQAGAARPIGGTYQKDGLYCLDPTCCGWVGADERDAALNGWRCFICGMDSERA